MGVSVVRPAAEVYAIQNDVVKQVAKALSVSLNPLQKKTLDKLPTQHTGAYEAFLEAKWIYQTKSPPENVYQAIAYLEKAAVLDSNFIGAYIWHRSYRTLLEDGVISLLRIFIRKYNLYFSVQKSILSTRIYGTKPKAGYMFGFTSWREQIFILEKLLKQISMQREGQLLFPYA
jgi:hypothetical protein